jgi:hypothetical protein
MKRSARLGRRVLAVMSIAIGVIVFTAGTAFAHYPVLSGTTVCAEGQHVITWSVWNNSGIVPDPMVLQGVTVTQGGVSVGTVAGFGNGTQLPAGIANLITGTTTLPGTMTGTVRLTVVGTYPGTTVANATRTADVVLVTNCVPSTTTTTTAPTTTTTAATTTTTAPTTTTTAATTTTLAPTTTTAPPTTVPTAPPTTAATVPQVSSTTAAPTSTAPTVVVSSPGGGGGTPVPGSSGQIAFTGSDSGPLLAVSIAAILFGLVALAGATRRRRSTVER